MAVNNGFPSKDPSSSGRHYLRSFTLAMLAILLMVSTLILAPRFAQVAPQPIGHASTAAYPSEHLGAVASESTICSDFGIQMFKDGGNAADALVATTFCVGVIGMYHSGIGGGGFMVVRAPNGTYENIDFRETAPAAAFQDMYKDNVNASIRGGLASGVPGEVRGLAHLHQNYGVLPWKHVMQGAIRTARYGWPVSEDLVRYMAATVSGLTNFLVDDPNWAVDFAPNGTLLGLGDTITRKRYADTLETIAIEGPDAFYTGSIAESIVNAVQAADGTMTVDDLKNYRVAIRAPANITYRNYKVVSCSAPSSGEVALSVLKTVEGYGDFLHRASLNLSTHRLDEAIRFGYGERTNLGDPSYVKDMADYQNRMLSEKISEEVRHKINDFHTLNVSDYDPTGLEILNNSGTSHVVTADASGLAISLTTTINLLFGSTVIVPDTGVIMNDEMNDFSVPGVRNAFGFIPSPANYIRPGKRPMSSISPSIVEFTNGSLYYVTGAAGGSRIITATIQSLVHVLDQNMTASEAIAQPRLHDQLIPNYVSFEYAYDNGTVAFMKSRGHKVTWVARGQSIAHAIRRLPNGTFEAAADPRQKNSGGFAI